jgi:hypothetical protein
LEASAHNNAAFLPEPHKRQAKASHVHMEHTFMLALPTICFFEKTEKKKKRSEEKTSIERKADGSGGRKKKKREK